MIRMKRRLRLLLNISFLYSCVYSLNVSTDKPLTFNSKIKITDEKSSSEPQSTHSPLKSSSIVGRKAFILSTSSCFLSTILFPQLALSEADGDQPSAPATKYFTGKQPVVPGAKPREKGDVKGTKKDPQFLLSISQCKVRKVI